jgi:hypothetical protein
MRKAMDNFSGRIDAASTGLATKPRTCSCGSTKIKGDEHEELDAS